jgi:hypothetical protein
MGRIYATYGGQEEKKKKDNGRTSRKSKVLGMLGSMWVNYIKIDIRNAEWCVMYWIYVAQDRDH